MSSKHLESAYFVCAYKKVRLDLMELTHAVICYSVAEVDQYGSLGTCKPQIIYHKILSLLIINNYLIFLFKNTK
jgi:hypothetical protein